MTTPATDPSRGFVRQRMRIGCHDGEPLELPAAWQPHPRETRLACSACLSMHPGTLYWLLVDVHPTPPPWERTSGVDRAYREWQGIYMFGGLTEGWPRRFHVLDQGAQFHFDARHLTDLPDPEFGAVTDVIARHAAVQFARLADGRLTYTGVAA